MKKGRSSSIPNFIFDSLSLKSLDFTGVVGCSLFSVHQFYTNPTSTGYPSATRIQVHSLVLYFIETMISIRKCDFVFSQLRFARKIL